MKKIKHIKFISSLLSLVMLITSAGIAPIKSMAADSDNGEKSAVQLAWFRANGKSDGEFDGSCGSNWYNTGDASSDESKITGANGCEVQSGNAFGFIIGFDMSDFDSEQQMAQLHQHFYRDKVETVFMMADARYAFISSTMAKQVISLGGDGKELVPENVLKKMKGRQY